MRDGVHRATVASNEATGATRTVTEGAVELLLPGNRDLDDAGPARRAGAFYNPAMATSRDLSVLVHRALAAACPRVLDGLAGAGARGLRVAAESGVARVVLNDSHPVAVEHLKRNVAVNGLGEAARVRQGDLADLLGEAAALSPFDAVDVDPYGTCAPWVRPAVEHLQPGGVLGVASTDTAVLHGVYPDVLKGRYGARMVRQEAEKEVGLRILLGFLARTAAEVGKGVHVLGSFQRGHHLRAWVRVTDRPDAVAGRTGFAHRCPDCGAAWLKDGGACDCGVPTEDSGPLWTGPLGDRSLLDALDVGLPTLATPGRTHRLVHRLREEAAAPALFHDLHRMGKGLKVSVPSFEALERALADAGFSFCRTHLVETGFRTDAPRGAVEELLAERSA